MRNFFKDITLILSATFILIISIDLILGNKIINFFFSNDKSVKHPIYHHDLDKNLNEKIIYNNVYEHIICTNNYGFKSSCIDKEKISKYISSLYKNNNLIYYHQRNSKHQSSRLYNKKKLSKRFEDFWLSI